MHVFERLVTGPLPLHVFTFQHHFLKPLVLIVQLTLHCVHPLFDLFDLFVDDLHLDIAGSLFPNYDIELSLLVLKAQVLVL